MIDQSNVELTPYNNLEKYLRNKESVLTETTEIVKNLESLVEEMDHRYDLLKNSKSRNIEEYNNKIGKELNEEIFGRKSENSKHLLEIKDLYRIEKDKQEDLIKQQHIDNLEYEEHVWILKSIILVGTIVFLILFGFLFIKHLRQKHKNEKELLKEKQKIKLQKKNEILELKNKELTESALRLMEKDEFIESIRKRLDNQKDSIDVNVIKRIFSFLP